MLLKTLQKYCTYVHKIASVCEFWRYWKFQGECITKFNLQIILNIFSNFILINFENYRNLMKIKQKKNSNIK